MPNPNYQRGVRWERKVKKLYEDLGWTVLRTAGSHGFFDLIAFPSICIPTCIQCKCLKNGTEDDAHRVAKTFCENPPLPRSAFFRQVIEVYAMKDKIRVSRSV